MSPPRVLVVDDDPLVLATMALQLEHAGFAAGTAASAAAALAACAAARPQLAVIDLLLPDMSGIELIRRLRELADLPCVLLTGMDDPGVTAQARAAGAVRCLRKPVDTARLHQILGALLPGPQLPPAR